MNTPSTSLPPLPLMKESIDTAWEGFLDAIQYDPGPTIFQEGDLINPTDDITNRRYLA